MVKVVTQYIASDGKPFDNKPDAENHELRVELAKFNETRIFMPRGEAARYAELLIENGWVTSLPAPDPQG